MASCGGGEGVLSSARSGAFPLSLASKQTLNNPFRRDRPDLFGPGHCKPISHKLQAHPSDSHDDDEAPTTDTLCHIGDAHGLEFAAESTTKEAIPWAASRSVGQSSGEVSRSLSRPKVLKLTKELRGNFATMDRIRPWLPEELGTPPVPLLSTTKKTLVLDLDETLIHSLDPAVDYVALNGDCCEVQQFCLDLGWGQDLCLQFFVRPFAIQLLQELSPLYDIIVRRS
jgi:hypothetical protein